MSAGLFSKVRRQEGGSNRESKRKKEREWVVGGVCTWMDGWISSFPFAL